MDEWLLVTFTGMEGGMEVPCFGGYDVRMGMTEVHVCVPGIKVSTIVISSRTHKSLLRIYRVLTDSEFWKPKT